MRDTRFARFVLAVNSAVPLAVLTWDAMHHNLGANPIDYAIHTTGWMALLFLTLSLSVTPLRKLTRLDWLVSFRRTLGVYGFVYAAAHLSIYFWWDRDRSISSTLSEIFGKPFITYGAAALLLLTPLAVTSTNGMIQRLGGKRWAWLHTLAYPATMLAAIHYYMEGKALTWDKRTFFYAVVVLLAYRWIAHLIWAGKSLTVSKIAVAPAPNRAGAARPKFWKGQLRVARVFHETPDVRTFRLTALDGGDVPFDYLPGQYLNLLQVIDGVKVPRSYTIASSPTRTGSCELTVKREDMGVSSRHLHERVREGDVLDVSAPAGHFTFTGTEADSIALIGGGVGITPLMSVIRYLTDHNWPGDMFLVYSAKTRADVIFAGELEYLQKRFPNLHVTISLTRDESPGWSGKRGRITPQLLAEAVPKIASRLFHICGPTEMMPPITQMLRDLGVPEDRIQSEAFVSSHVQTPDIAPLQQPASAAAPFAAPVVSSDGAGPLVTFAKSNKSIIATGSKTVLEASEDADVNIENECRSGICGRCKTKLLSGRVEMETRIALDNEEESQGFILACQAKPIGDVVVQA